LIQKQTVRGETFTYMHLMPSVIGNPFDALQFNREQAFIVLFGHCRYQSNGVIHFPAVSISRVDT